MTDQLDAIRQTIAEAAARGTRLRLRGGGTKDFYGGALEGALLDVRAYAGIVDYEPSELVVTARCGTPLVELEAALAERGQCLPFEPPHFGAGATLGGCIGAGLSGPRRASAGALRDFILGTRIVDGRGRVLQFGGRVMKNVAGYDVSRLMAGALGTLGVVVEASLKVLPRPAEEATLAFDLSEAEALDRVNRWAGRPLPISATAWCEGRLRVRLSGSPPAIRAARAALGGEALDDGAAFWAGLREHSLPFFSGAQPVWRIALPSTAAPLRLAGPRLVEWNGALRWLRSDAEPPAVRAAATQAGGHAVLFRAAEKPAGAFAALDPLLARLHRELKAAFDPAGVLNRGRLYPEF